MSDDGQVPETSPVADLLRSPISRKHIMKATAVGMVLAAFPLPASAAGQTNGVQEFSFPFSPPITSGTYSPESIQDILNAVLTPHYLAATGATTTLANASSLGLTGWELATQQAAAAREQYHIDFLASLGATPLVTAFTFPPAFFSSRAAVLATAETSASLLVAVHMTAAREFAELGQPMVAKWMYQMGTQVAEQRAIFRVLRAMDGVAGDIPPNNKAFATDLFLYTRDALGALKAIGVIGGSAAPVSYPGRDAVLSAAGPMADAILQKRPNDALSSISVHGPASLNGERS
ncbi:MAG TPA: hypothetical protein VFB58_00205 [Chloroflexota bacterium]|nr:hypothetical protein [Chloroflexota bacterium]